MIINNKCGRIYVGSSTQIAHRWAQHKSNLKHGRHTNPHLQSAWDKYGADAFSITLLEYVLDSVYLIEREQWWYDFLGTFMPMYNYSPCIEHPQRGMPKSKKTREKIGAIHRGKKLSEEHIESMIEAHKKPYPAFINWCTGEILPPGENLSAKCEELGLERSTMYRVFSGRFLHHRGWMLLSEWERGTRPRGTYPAFLNNVTGEEISPGINLSKMCKEYDLSYWGMQQLVNGRIDAHDNWVVAEDRK